MFLESILILLALGQTISSTDGANSTIYEACLNHSSYCLGLPDKCVVKSECQVLLRSHFDVKSSTFTLQLIASSIPVDHYLAVGFTNSSAMSGLVLQCYQSSQYNQTVFQYALNDYTHQHHSERIKLWIEVIGISNLETLYENGQLLCQWQLESKIAYHDSEFDLANDKYFIQLATGEYDPKNDTIHDHGKNSRISTTSAVSLKSNF